MVAGNGGQFQIHVPWKLSNAARDLKALHADLETSCHRRHLDTGFGLTTPEPSPGA